MLFSVATNAATIEFNRDIRPILSDRCFSCHGPDAAHRKAKLRLDVQNHDVAVPGKPDESLLIERITASDPDDLMPPPDFGKPLSKAEIELLRTWVKEGAEWQGHWAFEPVKRPPVAKADVSPVDVLIESRLRESKVKPLPASDARTLIRRASFDLIGLPPTPAEVDSFNKAWKADAKTAWRELIERLLSSQHYGERMAVPWLDLVRYADTLGYHGDQPRSVSPYRDYVIRAFNDNLPFDQFTRENLAGDLLPEAELWQKVASTYNRLNRASGEGGVQPKEYLAKYSADRARTTGAVWLGVTLGCAECHDHKYDPFTAKDFYSFAAYFADIKEQGIVKRAVHLAKLQVPTAEQATDKKRLEKALPEAEEKFNRNTPELKAAQRQWVKAAAANGKQWSVATPVTAKSKSGATLKIGGDKAVQASGKNPDKDVFTLTLKTDLKKLTGLRLEVLKHKSLPKNGPGRAGNGNLVLQKMLLYPKGATNHIEWSSGSATHTQKHHDPNYVASGTKTGWAIAPQLGRDHQFILTAKEPIALKDGDFRLEIVQNHGKQHTIGRFRLLVTDANAPCDAKDILPAAIAKIAAKAKRSEKEQKELDKTFRQRTPLLKEERDHLAKLRGEKETLNKAIVTTLGTEATKPREMRILPRGNWMDDSGEVVLPAVPAFLPHKQTKGDARQSRLDLANWLTSQDNPLVARTFVNRLWQQFFGYGLARSVDDLGSQGEPPTHPDLLDWLAAEFRDSGWDIKHMVRLMVDSDAYRRASFPTPELLAKDPENRLYARQSHWRLEAESLRDNALAIGGLLDRTIGGRSVKPYQPAGYWAQLNFPKRKYKQDSGASLYRRSLYTHWQRTFLHPNMLAFDAPAREECTAQRPRSNTPLQSLVLLNDPTYVEAARSLASKVMSGDEGEFDARLQSMYRRALQREANDDELKALELLYRANLKEFGEETGKAKKLTAVGASKVEEKLDAAELAAWTMVARAILNLHETITRY